MLREVKPNTSRYIYLLSMTDSVIVIIGSGERIDAKVNAKASTKVLALHPKAKVNPATVNKSPAKKVQG